MKSHFSVTLSSLRRKKGLSQREAAADLGVSQALLSHYENGAREPKLEFVVKACDYYDVSADHILGRTDTKRAGAMPVPRDCDGARRLIDAACAVFDKLDDLSDPDLYESAVRYLTIPAENLTALICNPAAPYDPMREVNMKLAESSLIAVARKNGDGRE